MFEVGTCGTEAVIVDRLVGHLQQLAQAQARVLADLVAVADATPNPEFAAFEISSAATWTRQTATVQLELAHNVVRRLPAVHAAMTAGEIDLPKARVITDGVLALDLDLARDIVAAILPLAPGLTTGELRARLAKLVIAADPDAAAKRHRVRARQRRVELQPSEDSCATLLGINLPADTALAATNRLTALARGLKQAGDPRSLDQLRADTFLNLLLGNNCHCHGSAPGRHGHSTALGRHGHSTALGRHGHDSASSHHGHSTASSHSGAPSHHHGHGTVSGGSAAPGHHSSPAGHAQPHDQTDRSQRHAQPTAASTCCCGGSTSSGRSGGVELTGDLETLTRLNNQPGHLAGYGPVIAEITRQVAAQQRRAPWTFTIRDKTTGRVFTGPVRRRPTTAMARHVRARDRTCRAPGCRRPAIYADIDHTIAHELGGPTVPGNLGALCRYHHRAKHEGWWLLVQIRPGVFVWRSPLGRRYTVYPAAP